MAELKAMRPVICDAGPLIHLEELGCPALLRDFAAVHVADAVWREVARHRPKVLRRRPRSLDEPRDKPSAHHAALI